MSSFWDEFKDLFKTKKQLAEEKQQEIDDVLDKEEGLVEELKKLENDLASQKKEEVEPDWDKIFPTKILDEKQYTPKTDEELYQSARYKTDFEKQGEQQDLYEAYKKSVESLGEQKEESQTTLEDAYKQLEMLYDDLRRDTQYDAIERGMLNSSHTKNQLESIEKGRVDAVSSAKSNYQQQVDEIDAKLARLEIDKDNALAELDVKFAIELSEQIDELKKERDKAIEQNTKFNNDVREKNAKAQATKEKNIAEYKRQMAAEKREREEAQQAYEDKYGYVGKKQENYAQRYDMAFEFYTSLSPDIALEALIASPNMKYYLGKYYDKLYSALRNIQPEQTIYY